ncbi:MAG: DUF1893 domain-containing protein [Oscillospiraceae bacterium]|nr:DUF1893 domain-containing protein [Oscillospiraceae bacterium]
MTKQTIQMALRQIEAGSIVCAAIREGEIIAFHTGRGVAPVLQMYQQGQLAGSILVDKVVGKAAAMVMTRGGVVGCHAVTMSKAALQWFQQQRIQITYDYLTEYIVNRTGDGMCPMEQTVLNLQDDSRIVSVLEEKLSQLRDSKQ